MKKALKLAYLSKLHSYLIILAAQSIEFAYGMTPFGSGLIVCIRVAMVSKGILKIVATPAPTAVPTNLFKVIGPKK